MYNIYIITYIVDIDIHAVIYIYITTHAQAIFHPESVSQAAINRSSTPPLGHVGRVGEGKLETATAFVVTGQRLTLRPFSIQRAYHRLRSTAAQLRSVRSVHASWPKRCRQKEKGKLSRLNFKLCWSTWGNKAARLRTRSRAGAGTLFRNKSAVVSCT